MKQLMFMVMLVVSLKAHAADYRSNYGFSFQLPAEWLVLTPAQVQKTYQGESLKSMELAIGDRATFEAVLQKVKAGEVEYFFDRKYSTREFKNNISVQLMPPRPETPDQIAKDSCPSLAMSLRGLYGAEVKVTSCGIQTLAKVPFVAYEYRVPSQGVNVIQFEIPFGPKGTLILVGGSNDAGLAHVRVAQTSIADSAARSIKNAPNKPLEPTR